MRAGSSSERQGGTVGKIRRFLQHSSYRRRTLDYDFTLIQLAEPLIFSYQIQSVQLPNQNDGVEDGTQCLVSGWSK